MRQVISAYLLGKDPRDISLVVNPECVAAIRVEQFIAN